MTILRGPRANKRASIFLTVVFIVLASLFGAVTNARAQCTDPTATRPILFVHGFLGGSTDWGNSSDSGLRGSVISQLASTDGYSNSADYDLYFNGANVLVSKGNPATDPVVTSTPGQPGYIPCDARFFSIKFYGWATPAVAFDQLTVAQISVLTKAYELSQVLKAIAGLTLVKDVIVVAHSMGALDARAYVEGLGSTFAPCTNASYPCYLPGSLDYTAEVGHLVTVDGANAGGAYAQLAQWLLGIRGTQFLNVIELDPNSTLVQTLNYHGSYADNAGHQASAQQLPPGLAIDALVDYYSADPVFCTLTVSPTCSWDLVVTSDSQSIVAPLSGQGFQGLTDISNYFSTTDPTISNDPNCVIGGFSVLHSLLCLADWHSSAEQQTGGLLYQAISPYTSSQLTNINFKVTNNGQPWTGPISLTLSGPNGSASITNPQLPLSGPTVPSSPQVPSVPPLASIPYTLTYLSGGPPGAGSPMILGADASGNVCSPCYLQPGNWSLTFLVSFASGTTAAPSVTTQQPTGLSGSGATFTGIVNPNGATTTAWFEWGVTAGLGYSTSMQSIGSGTVSLGITSVLGNLESSTTYYYRVDASNGKTTTYGNIVSFTTSGTLSSPTLITPSNSSTNVSTTPTFGWSAVGGSSSYRLLVATTPAALPTDPTSSTCGLGCVLDVTPNGTTYTAPSEVLDAATTYYWEVHARSPLQYGTWSSVWSFSTSSPTLTNVAMSPSAITSGSSASVTVTLNGPAPSGGAQVSLTTTNRSAFPVPSSIPIAAGSTTGSISVVGGTVSTATPVTVTGTYGGSVVSGVVTVSPSGGSVFLNSFTITPSTIAGGYSTQGNVFLTGPAPASGATVSLSSNNPHFVQVPTSQNVVVQPGYTSVAFPITTSFTSGTVGATISASYNSTTYLAALTVLPVVASGVTFYPSSVDAGSPAPLTVYLNGPAPAGTSVSLTSSAPSVLQVPGSVPVPTGATSVSITGTTLGVSSQTNVTVTATYNGGSAQGSLTVVPLSLIGFSLNPQGVTGGSSVTGTVWLSDIAPSGGVNISLSSASTLVQVPPTVNVPAGSATTNFSITTSAVTSVTNVTVTAVYSGVSDNVTLALVPPTPFLASLIFSPSTVNSGSSTTGTVTLTSPALLGGAGISLTSSFYAVANVPNAVIVQSGATSATFTVPTAAIGFISPVTVTATYNGTTQNSLLTVVPPGTPLAPSSLTLSPWSVTGGHSSTATVLLTSPAPTGGAALTLTSDNVAVQVPPVVTVPAGLNSATFSATTSSVTNVATATIKATYNGLSESSLLTVEPAGTKPIGNPVPFLSAPLAPESQNPGGSGLTLTLAGSGFVSGAQAWWNKTALPTTFKSSEQLQVSVPPADIQENGSAIVTVTNPGAVKAASNGLAEHLTYSIATPFFGSSSISDTGGLPSVVATADLNGDGVADLVVGGADSNALAVFLGRGDGTFGPELLLPGAASSIVVGDFNGDGIPDIATAAGGLNSTVVQIFLGNGDGTFTSAPGVVLGTGIFGSTSLATADLNGDGYLDLVVTVNYLTQVYVLLGNGDGTFAGPTSFGSVNQPCCLAVADFNNDGKLDIAVSDFDNQSVAILFGNGNGTFQSQTEYPAGGYPYGISAADFNGDGHPDVAVATAGFCCGGSGGVSVLLNTGHGAFASPVPYGAGLRYYSVSTDDVNGDGKLDLLVTDGQEGQLYLGNGDGTFATNPIPIPAGPEPFSATIVDLNNDGAPDLVVPNQISGTGNVTILLQSIAPVLQATPLSLSFTATQGQGAPSPQNVAITNAGGGAETWSATASQSWVSLGNNTGAAPSTLNVSVNPAGLTPGNYPATIAITAPGASNSPQAITVTLVVNPAALVVESLAFRPPTIIGAGTTTGTATLSSSAPVGGATIALSTNNSAVQVPPSVTVPVGLLSANFTATAAAVTSQTIVAVTATYNGVSTTATLTLNPNTIPLNVSPTSLSYGNQGISSTSASKKVTITNNTGAVVTISSMAINGTDPTDFAQSATTCGNSLAVKGSCTISIAFTPTALGARSAALILVDSAANSPQTVALSGTGVLQVSLSPVTLAFGSEADGSVTAAKTVTLANNTTAALSISSAATTGANASEFSVSANACGVSVASHSSCKISVTFAPVTPGAKTASLTIRDSANNSPQSVSLSGTGIAPVSITPASVTFAAQKVGTTSAGKNVTIKNNLKTTLTFSGITVTGTDAGDFSQSATTCGGTLGAGLSCTVSITFTPAAKGSRTADLSISDSAITSPQTLVLSGTGK